MAAKTCVICGKPSGIYPLCIEHLEQKREGKVVKCEKCGAWHYKDKPCKCPSPSQAKPEPKQAPTSEVTANHAFTDKPKSAAVASIGNNGTCLTCGEPTDGKRFCLSCYRKYKDKSLLIRIDKCESLEVLDESYEGIYICKDGHVVKSKSERDIDNYLFENGIKHAYEKEIRIDNKTTIHPDFYLPDLNAYIEHWGYDESNHGYTEIKKKKMDFYRSEKYTLICTYEKTDAKNIESALEFKLSHFKNGEINFEE